MSPCEICAEIYGYNTPCETCLLGNPCIGCSDYVNGNCTSNGGCGENKEVENE